MSDDAPNRRSGRPSNPRWTAIPIDTRLTISEAARILGIERESLRKNYLGDNAPRKLPEGIDVIRDGQTVLIVRRM